MRAPWRRFSPIGLDVDSRWLRLAQVVSGRDGQRLHAACRVPRLGSGTFGRADAELVSNLIEWRGFQRTGLVVTPPREGVVSAPLELPPASGGAPLGQIALMELARAARCEAGQLHAVMWPLPAPARATDATHVLSAGVRAEVSEAYLAALEEVGLCVEAMDLREWGLVRGCGGWGACPGLLCTVDIGWDASTIILTLDGTVLFTRTMELSGLSRLYEVLRERRGIGAGAMDALLDSPDRDGADVVWEESASTLRDYVEALIPEVRRSLTYAEHRHPGKPVSGALLCGEGAVLPGMANAIGQECGVMCRVVHPSDTISLSPGTRGVGGDPGLICALGLAFHDSAKVAGRLAA